jgi:hypothetical protein
LRVDPWLTDRPAATRTFHDGYYCAQFECPTVIAHVSRWQSGAMSFFCSEIPQRTNEVLDVLIASGVLRAEPKESGDSISLRYEALTREWDRLRALIAERVDFRDTVAFWDQRARANRALASAGLADKALADYADLNALELAFIAASSSLSRRKIITLSIVCAVALGVFGFVSNYFYERWVAAKQEAEAATAILVAISNNKLQLKEESIRKLASFGKRSISNPNL